jgi:ribose 5-phosphate isomerase B
MLVVGADAVGSEFLGRLLAEADIVGLGHDVEDLSCHTDEPGYARVGVAIGEAVRDGHADRGVLVCGTGLGVCIAANKVHGVRAAVCHDLYSTERSILSNNCQVACFGARVIGVQSAARLLVTWLGVSFDATSASADKLEHLRAIEDWERRH